MIKEWKNEREKERERDRERERGTNARLTAFEFINDAQRVWLAYIYVKNCFAVNVTFVTKLQKPPTFFAIVVHVDSGCCRYRLNAIVVLFWNERNTHTAHVVPSNTPMQYLDGLSIYI